MKNTLRVLFSVVLAAGLLPVMPAAAAVTLSAAPASLVTDPLPVKSSATVGLFKFSLTADAGETLTSVSAVVSPVATTTVVSSHLASIAVYKDNGSGTFDPATDTFLAAQALVNMGSSTVIILPSSTPAGGSFFVSLNTASSWTDAAPGDKISVTLPAGGIVTSLGSAASIAVTTNTLFADTVGPQLISATVQNTGGTNTKEIGDSVNLTFSEPTNKPTVTGSNISTLFGLNNGHSFLDGSGSVATSWNVAGTVLTITLTGSTTAATTLASVQPGDTVTVNSSAVLTDLAGNQAFGSQTISGNFAGSGDDEDENGDEEVRHVCANSLTNGLLYKVGTDQTVYLAAACQLKPFRGAAVFHARSQKFQNIIQLSAMPANVTVSQKPVLPTAGTLVKGSNKTVWFITSDGARRGFVSGSKFLSLGFSFNKVQQISDSDLELIPASAPVQESDEHPDGTLLKCANLPAVFEVVGNTKFPFANSDAFTKRGHSFDYVVNVNCGRFGYPTGAAVNE